MSAVLVCYFTCCVYSCLLVTSLTQIRKKIPLQFSDPIRSCLKTEMPSHTSFHKNQFNNCDKSSTKSYRICLVWSPSVTRETMRRCTPVRMEPWSLCPLLAYKPVLKQVEYSTYIFQGTSTEIRQFIITESLKAGSPASKPNYMNFLHFHMYLAETLFVKKEILKHHNDIIQHYLAHVSIAYLSIRCGIRG